MNKVILQHSVFPAHLSVLPYSFLRIFILVPVPIPTNYEAQGYEGSGSPISVPITAHGTSVSPSLWPAQHPGYSTSPYPSPPTGPPPVQTPYDPTAYISNAQTQIFAPPPHPHPQFISDPTIINYVPPGPPPAYGTQFHSQGFQGYPPVVSWVFTLTCTVV